MILKIMKQGMINICNIKQKILEILTKEIININSKN